LAHQIAVRGDLADRIAGRHDARRPQLLLDAPEMEMLERALREVLSLRNAVERHAALDQRAADAPEVECNAEHETDRTAADNDDLRVLQNAGSLWHELRMTRLRASIATSLLAALFS